MELSQVEELNKLSFVWDTVNIDWVEGFNHLEEFVKREGHAMVPASYKTFSGFNLGMWVQRKRQRKRKLKTKQIESLESMKGWCWDVLTLKWEIGLSHLVEYVERAGCPSPPQKYITDDGYKLGNWISNQRIR